MDTPNNKKMTRRINNTEFTLHKVSMLALEANTSYRSIGRAVGVSDQTIKHFMMKHGISMDNPRYHSASVRAMNQARSDSSDRISVQSLVNP